MSGATDMADGRQRQSDAGGRGIGLLRERGIGLLRGGRGIGLLRNGASERGIGLLAVDGRGIGLLAKGIGLLSVATVAGGTFAVGAPAYASVLVTSTSSGSAAAAVRGAGGQVTAELSVVDGVVAKVPVSALDMLRGGAGVTGVVADVAGRPAGMRPSGGAPNGGSAPTGAAITRDGGRGAADAATGSYDPTAEVGSMYNTARMIGADAEWAAGNRGRGVAVAIVDSGVLPGPAFGPRLEPGIDVSGANNALADGFGHGTHIAGIVAGQLGMEGRPTSFTGIAPDSRIVSVRVADAAGSTSLLKILQGLDWVYKNAATRNIKVANLSLGVPGYSSYGLDPLAAASERLWESGVTVVASAGNFGSGRGLASPAYDPFVIAVGALDTKGTLDPSDDSPADFSASSSGPGKRTVDVLVPGRSIQSLKAANSTLALAAPATSLVGTAFVKGSGTSQAAGEVSGLVALMYAADATLSPDDVKANLCSSASVAGGDSGCGVPSAKKMRGNGLSRGHRQGWQPATASVTTDPTADGQSRTATVQGASWQGASWQGASWQGASWQGASWQGASWQSQSWQGLLG